MATGLIETSDKGRIVEDIRPYFETFDVPHSRLVHGNPFPLGLKLNVDLASADLETATAYVEALADDGMLNSLLSKYGSILFRGLPIRGAEDFSKFTKAFKLPQLHQEVGLSGKRSTLAGGYVKTANEEPPDVKFYYHNEYGRSAHFPGVLFFYAQLVPRQGGQTPLLSTIELYDALREELPEFVDTLIQKGENITIEHEIAINPESLDVSTTPAKKTQKPKKIGWNWQDSYGFTIDPEDSLEDQNRKVEYILRTELQAEAEWQHNDALHVVQRLPAFRRIASTGQIVPFNGIGGVYGRQRDREALQPPYRGIDGGTHLPTTYGDGSTIPREYLEKMLLISDRIGFLVPWE